MQKEIKNLENYYTIKEMADYTDRSIKTIRRYTYSKLFTEVIRTPNLILIHKNEIHKIYKPLNKCL